jgi:hypothetical protein
MAPVYDALDAIYEWSWKRRLRAELFRHARGRGARRRRRHGLQHALLPAGSEVVGIDASRGMLERRRERAKALGRRVDLREMNLLRLASPTAASTPSRSPSSCSACPTSFSSRRSRSSAGS